MKRKAIEFIRHASATPQLKSALAIDDALKESTEAEAEDAMMSLFQFVEAASSKLRYSLATSG
jgi:hypothetical protein